MKTSNLNLFIIVILAATLNLAISACTGSGDSGSEDGDHTEDGDKEASDNTDGDQTSDGDEESDGDETSNGCPNGYEMGENGFCVPAEVTCPPGFKPDDNGTTCVLKTEYDKAADNCAEIMDFSFAKEQVYGVFGEKMSRNFLYFAFSAEEYPMDILSIKNYGGLGSINYPGTVTKATIDQPLEELGYYVLYQTGCSKNENLEIVCDKSYMHIDMGSTKFNHLDVKTDELFDGALEEMVLEQVEIDDENNVTVAENRETLCIDNFQFKAHIQAGLVDMPRPEGLSCSYPDSPYVFWGPTEGDISDPEITPDDMGTVPPMAWPGAYVDGEQIGFDLAEYRCENPEVKTLFIMLGAGWCPACSGFYSTLCRKGGLLEQLRAQNAEVMFVVGDNDTPGDTATNEFALAYPDRYGCSGGIRFSDTDNSAGKRVIWRNGMSEGIPWVAAIRMSDMKLVMRDFEYENSLLQIAQDNNQ